MSNRNAFDVIALDDSEDVLLSVERRRPSRRDSSKPGRLSRTCIRLTQEQLQDLIAKLERRIR